MSDYDVDERPSLNILALVLNILTAMALLAALCWGVIFLNIFLNPQAGFNPFPPPTLPPTAPAATDTPAAAQRLPATHTPQPATETPVPTMTSTPAPSLTPSPTPTRFVLVSLTPVPVTEEPDLSNVSFRLREGSPLALQNFAHPELGCDFLGVAGQAFDAAQQPIVQGITIHLGGLLAGQTVDLLSLTGATNLYGPGSYEFILADRPIASTNTMFIELLDQAGLPLSEKIFFDTFEDCERNLILINFQQFR